jgi:hypothetical protein
MIINNSGILFIRKRKSISYIANKLSDIIEVSYIVNSLIIIISCLYSKQLNTRWQITIFSLEVNIIS